MTHLITHTVYLQFLIMKSKAKKARNIKNNRLLTLDNR